MLNVHFVWVRPQAPFKGWRVTEDGVLMRDVRADMAEYEPIWAEPAIHRVFADISDGRPAMGLFDFVRRYGLLFTPLGPGPALERHEQWVPRIKWMRHLIGCWELVRDREIVLPLPDALDDAELAEVQAQLFELTRPEKLPDGPRVISIREPEFPPGCDIPERWAARPDWWHVPASWTVAPDGRVHTDKVSWAVRSYLAARVSEELAGRMCVGLDVGPSSDRLEVVHYLPDLWHAIVYLFALEMAQDRRFRRCVVCGLWLLETEMRKVFDPSSTTCSAACRQSLYRRRQGSGQR